MQSDYSKNNIPSTLKINDKILSEEIQKSSGAGSFSLLNINNPDNRASYPDSDFYYRDKPLFNLN